MLSKALRCQETLVLQPAADAAEKADVEAKEGNVHRTCECKNPETIMFAMAVNSFLKSF